MKAFCTNCLTNWASLHNHDGEGDESYEYCPLCRTDSYLEEARPGDEYMMCAFTGNVINANSGEQKQQAVAPAKASTHTPFSWENWKKQKEAQERQEEADIIEYQHLYEQGDLEQAEQHYFELRRKHATN